MVRFMKYYIVLVVAVAAVAVVLLIAVLVVVVGSIPSGLCFHVCVLCDIHLSGVVLYVLLAFLDTPHSP